jgi:NADH-quinone oxidoreductase subunit E
MYLTEQKGKYLLELCTCFTCGECGGREMWDYLMHKLQLNDEGFSPDGPFWLREAECLGAAIRRRSYRLKVGEWSSI